VNAEARIGTDVGGSAAAGDASGRGDEKSAVVGGKEPKIPAAVLGALVGPVATSMERCAVGPHRRAVDDAGERGLAADGGKETPRKGS
jgi:hypothetical protein